MAGDIAKSGTPSVSTIGPMPGVGKLPTLLTGEAIAAGDACYVASDGTIMLSNATTGDEPASVYGYAPIAAESGVALTLVHNVVFRYGSSLTPGTPLYLSAAVSGAISDTQSAGAPGVIGFVVDTERVYLRQNFVKTVHQA